MDVELPSAPGPAEDELLTWLSLEVQAEQFDFCSERSWLSEQNVTSLLLDTYGNSNRF